MSRCSHPAGSASSSTAVPTIAPHGSPSTSTGVATEALIPIERITAGSSPRAWS